MVQGGLVGLGGRVGPIGPVGRGGWVSHNDPREPERATWVGHGLEPRPHEKDPRRAKRLKLVAEEGKNSPWNLDKQAEEVVSPAPSQTDEHVGGRRGETAFAMLESRSKAAVDA